MASLSTANSQPLASAPSSGGTDAGLKAGHDCKIFVGNLPYKATKLDLVEVFSAFGAIRGVNMRKDRETDKSRGFAFVTLDTPEAARAAIAEVHGRTMDGRALTVKPALARGQTSEIVRVGEAGDGSLVGGQDDGSWATAPPRRHRGKNRHNVRHTANPYGGRQARGHGSNPPQKKSWTEWASYPAESVTRASPSGNNGAAGGAFTAASEVKLAVQVASTIDR